MEKNILRSNSLLSRLEKIGNSTDEKVHQILENQVVMMEALQKQKDKFNDY